MSFASSIVVATDLSPASYAALEEAARLTRFSGCEVRLLYVFDLAPWGSTEQAMQSKPALRRVAEEATGAASSVLLGLRERFFPGLPRVEIATTEFDGTADGICAYARACGADLIVVAARGRSHRSSQGVGNVTERVVRQAPCRVLIVPSEAAAPIAH